MLFGENAGKQCVAMSLSAIIYHHIEDVNLWTSSTLNNILGIGNNLYTSIRYSVRTNDYLLLTDVPGIVSLFDKCDLSHENVLNGIHSNGRTHGKRTDEKRVGKLFRTDKANG